jgi:hypothetical protein
MLGLSALSASFRHDISAASETYSADIRQKCQPGFHADYACVHKVTAIPRLITACCFSFFVKSLE